MKLSPCSRRSLSLLPLCGLSFCLPVLAQTAPTSPAAPTLQSRTEALNEAVRKGDLAAVKSAVEADPKLLTSAARGNSPLYAAIQGGKTDIVVYLLEKGVDPNAVIYGNAPLTMALRGYNESWKPMSEALVAKGAKINGLDNEGTTPLMSVISYGSNGQKDKINWLISKGADLTARNRSGQSALEFALSNSSTDVVTLFLAKSDINARNSAGNTPLFTAVGRNSAEFVRLLVDKGADLNAQNAAGDTVLHLAARTPGPLLKTLIDAGARTDLKNKRGDLPIHIALRRREDNAASRIYFTGSFRNGSPDSPETATPRGALIAPLLDKSDVNARDAFGLSPLLLADLARDQESRDLIIERAPRADSTTKLFDAAAQGNVADMKTLLTQKPYLVYFRLADGSTPLHIAALWGTLGAAQMLAQKGADVNARDGRGETPLHEAVSRPTGTFARRAKNMTSFLLEKGAQPNAVDSNDSSPLHRATQSGDAELITALLAKNADVNARDANGQTPLFALMTKDSDLKVVTAMIDKGADLNTRPQNGGTLLARAVQTRRKELVSLLLDKGADVKSTDSEGRSPLSAALYSGGGTDDLAPIAQLLLAKGADPNEKIYGDSLLMRAISNDNKEMVRVLLATKKVELKNTDGRTSPLMQAVSYGRSEIVTLLLDAGADPNETDERGRTVAQIATERSKELGALFAAKPKDNKAVTEAAAAPANPPQ